MCRAPGASGAPGVTGVTGTAASGALCFARVVPPTPDCQGFPPPPPPPRLCSGSLFPACAPLLLDQFHSMIDQTCMQCLLCAPEPHSRDFSQTLSTAEIFLSVPERHGLPRTVAPDHCNHQREPSATTLPGADQGKQGRAPRGQNAGPPGRG